MSSAKKQKIKYAEIWGLQEKIDKLYLEVERGLVFVKDVG